MFCCRRAVPVLLLASACHNASAAAYARHIIRVDAQRDYGRRRRYRRTVAAPSLCRTCSALVSGCAPAAHGSGSDADCCPGTECRGLLYVDVTPAPECTPSGAHVVDPDGEPPCCTGMSYRASHGATCCNSPASLCSADEQCCFGGPCACAKTESLVNGTPIASGVGACCLPPGTFCSRDILCCGGLSCGPNCTCCLPSHVTCAQDTDCCEGHCVRKPDRRQHLVPTMSGGTLLRRDGFIVRPI
jgi:hypothetical protein